MVRFILRDKSNGMANMDPFLELMAANENLLYDRTSF